MTVHLRWRPGGSESGRSGELCDFRMIVALICFARGPTEQDRSTVQYDVVQALTNFVKEESLPYILIIKS